MPGHGHKSYGQNTYKKCSSQSEKALRAKRHDARLFAEHSNSFGKNKFFWDSTIFGLWAHPNSKTVLIFEVHLEIWEPIF